MSRVAAFNLQKCESNWWYNVLFINNYFLNSIDICGGHSFYSSVDMQLFALGLLALCMFASSSRQGLLFSVAMVVFGTWKVAHSAIKYETAFSLFVVNPVPHKIVEFFHYIHMQTSSYMAAYFVGFLLAYARMKGHMSPTLDKRSHHLAFLLILVVVGQAVNVNAMLRNTLDMYPDSLNWLFISVNRIMQLCGAVACFLYIMSFKNAWLASRRQAIEQDPLFESRETLSPFKALCRLCFPLYVCNYLYIRTEFFTRRFLEPTGLFWMFKRLLSSVLLVYVFTIVFQVLLLGPLDAVREHMTKPKQKPASPSNKQQSSVHGIEHGKTEGKTEGKVE